MEFIDFLDVCENQTRLGTKIKVPDYLEEGSFPIVDQSKKLVIGYTNNEEGLYKDIPFIVFGDVTRIFKYIDFPAFLGADGSVIIKVKNPNFNSKFIYYSLLNSYIPNTGYNRHFKFVKELKIPCYSLEKQKEIVEDYDRLIFLGEKLEKQILLFDELIKSRFIEMFGDVCNNANTINLEDLCEKITDGSHNPPKGIESSNNLMISSQNIHDNIIDYKDARLLSDRDFAIEDKRTSVRIGDVLLTIVGAIGRSAVVTDDIKVTCQRSVCVIHPKKDAVNPVFLKHMLDCIACQIETEARGVAQKGIYLNQVKKLQVIKPDIEKQKEFASFVEQIDKSKSNIKNELSKIEELIKKLNYHYFVSYEEE